jgi:hypothetical protein
VRDRRRNMIIALAFTAPFAVLVAAAILGSRHARKECGR